MCTGLIGNHCFSVVWRRATRDDFAPECAIWLPEPIELMPQAEVRIVAVLGLTEMTGRGGFGHGEFCNAQRKFISRLRVKPIANKGNYRVDCVLLGEQPVPSLRTNLVKRIDRLPKPSNTADAMQPLFEAVSNSIHSTQDRFRENVARDGRVVVTIATGRKQAPVKIVVEDNGNGLDERNFDAFSTTDTDNKYARGGKGVGRLLWLDCFEGIKVKSVYTEGQGCEAEELQVCLVVVRSNPGLQRRRPRELERWHRLSCRVRRVTRQYLSSKISGPGELRISTFYISFPSNIHRFEVASSDRSLWRRNATLPGRDQLGYPSKRGDSEHRKRGVWPAWPYTHGMRQDCQR